jgi:hypothetical protein
LWRSDARRVERRSATTRWRRTPSAGSGRASGVLPRAPDVGAVFCVGEVDGVGAREVVEAVPARSVFGEQVCPGERGEHLSVRRGVSPVRLVAAGREMSGPGCSPSSRNSRAASLSSVRPVRPEEHGPDVGAGVAGVEGVQRARVALFLGEPGERESSASLTVERLRFEGSSPGAPDAPELRCNRTVDELSTTRATVPVIWFWR